MSSSRSTDHFASTPVELHTALADAFSRGDLDGLTALYEPDATLVAPPDGDLARGRAAIRAATEPFMQLRPRLTSTVHKVVEGDGLALTHARWTLVGTHPDGRAIELHGRGTIVSRRRVDGTWGIVLDDALTPD